MTAPAVAVEFVIEEFDDAGLDPASIAAILNGCRELYPPPASAAWTAAMVTATTSAWRHRVG